eukprot:maker-scaffold_1-snap-gene-14.2-mRNA-1 protein AED:0.00 eAED:0.00 QI:108/1/1/1/1/1/2/527/432
MNLVEKYSTEGNQFEESNLNQIQFIGFNQVGTCISVSTATSVNIYRTDNLKESVFPQEGGIKLAKMLFNSSFICLVGGGKSPAFSSRILRIVDLSTNFIVSEQTFTSPIKDVLLNYSFIIVVLQNSAHVYEFDTFTTLKILEFNQNPAKLYSKIESSIVALTNENQKECLLALPSGDHGDVLIYDLLTMKDYKVINAHKTQLQCLSFSKSSQLLCSSSIKGTVLRVFNVHSGELLFNFRRGFSTATIFSLSFDNQDKKLVASSSSGTIHVFYLGQVSQYIQINSNFLKTPDMNVSTSQGSTSSSVYSTKSSPVSTGRPGFRRDNSKHNLSSVLRIQNNKINKSPQAKHEQRSFSTLKIKEKKYVCELNEEILFVLGASGTFYKYSIQKGKCILLQKEKLITDNSLKNISDSDFGVSKVYKYEKELTENIENS